jgi:hypothetical protein
MHRPLGILLVALAALSTFSCGCGGMAPAMLKQELSQAQTAAVATQAPATPASAQPDTSGNTQTPPSNK